ncbi:MAG: gliding motility-associated C-terminal domain-containing protein [Flavobacteriales bacterium]|nr:gliding motility-associated C-terminal domain-containing protein [Flavobacteriales bacterium]
MLTTIARRSRLPLLPALFTCSGAFAQPYWIKDVGGVGNDHVADVKVDADGSIYLTGEFGGTMTVGGQTYSSAGSIDFFVAKLDPAGTVLWFRTGGGSGIDRGLKVALGAQDELVFAGEFLGTATFQGQSITSVGGTADMFVAVLNKADGALQWMQQGGGGDGTDRPYGVSLATDGRVAVAGEFRGNASWSGTVLTSAIDPGTGQFDSDVFIATYSPVGDLQWLKQGTAKYADRAIDVVHDPAGNLYVTGQFSDTITFDLPHPNTLLNASFLVKYDQGGSEVWFRRMGGGGFNHVRDMQLKADGRLAMVGDVQGTMIYFGVSQTNVASGEPYAYYLLDVDQGGALIAHTTVGSTSGVSAAGLSVQGNDIAVIGQFNCRFTDLSALYGEGVFMAVGPEDLFVSRHQVSGLALLEGQQFGGRSAKTASAIAHTDNGQVVFTGSYQGNLIFPATPGMTGDISTSGGLEGNGIDTYCGDTNYGRFVANTAAALTDGFIARGYVEGREPYDWWRRTDSGCERIELEPCIRTGSSNECPDTVRACVSLLLNANLRFSNVAGRAGTSWVPRSRMYGPPAARRPRIGVVATDDYWVRITSTNGCYTWTDTIQAIIDPAPQIPLISDDVVLNTASNNTQTIELCDPETHWVWTPNGASSGSTVYWTLPDGTQVMNDSVVVDTTGVYTVTSVSSNGCTRSNSVNVIDRPSVPLPDIDVDIAIAFPDDTDGNDTLQLCPGESFEYTYTPSWTVNGVPSGGLPEGLLVNWGFAVPVTAEADDGPQSTMLPSEGGGWIVRELVVMVSNKPCGEDSVLFFKTDSIYVDLYPTLNTQVTITGPTVLCDGDSAVITASCSGCDELVWNGPSFTQLTPESILVHNPGTYSVQGSAEDPYGCSSQSSASITVTMPTGQVLNLTPADGIICPGSSATLSTTTVGTGHIWYGPQGPITGQGASLQTTVPGDYYLVMQVGGCEVTSNSATLVNYGTPYLDASPGPELCRLGEVIDLLVVATPGSAISWNAPLTGDEVSQPINAPGTYSVSVTACEITTELSIEIGLADVQVSLSTPGPFTLCNGDSVLLEGSANQPNLLWMPGGITGASAWVSATGSYYLVAEDEAGCADSTAVVQVTAIGFPVPLAVADTSVCAGDGVQLVASGSGNITWFADPGLTQVIAAGPSYTFLPTGSTVLYATQSQGGCEGGSEDVTVEVRPRPAALAITGPSAVCTGSDIVLSVVAPDTVSVQWSTPNGPAVGSTISIIGSTSIDAGVYTCVAVYDGCASPGAALPIGVFDPEPLDLPEALDLCTGGAVDLAVPSTFRAVQWSTGSTSTGITVSSGQEISVAALDQHGCVASALVVVIEDDCDLVIPNVFSPNGDGQNESWLPTGGFVSANTRIYNRWGNLVFDGDMVQKPWNGKHLRSAEPCSEGVYYFVMILERANGSSVEKSGYIELIR